MLDDLVGVIETLQQRISDYGASLRENETRTRMALIDPLLTVLGWDVSDPSLVTPEYNVGQGRADYALNGSESIPAAIVEAKRLGHTLNDDERMQMLNYANARGVRYATVTDGDAWELYEVFKQAPLEDRRLLRLRIFNMRPHELALQLLLLWQPNLSSGKATPAEGPVLVTVPKPAMIAIFDESAETSSAQTNEPSPVLTPPATVGNEWLKLSDWNPPTKTPAPKVMRFPDGTEASVQKWKNLLVVAGDWLNATGKLASVSKPILNGAKERVLDSDNSGLISPTPVSGTNFWLNTHGNAGNLRQKTRAILNHCGVNPGDVWLKVDP